MLYNYEAVYVLMCDHKHTETIVYPIVYLVIRVLHRYIFHINHKFDLHHIESDQLGDSVI